MTELSRNTGISGSRVRGVVKGRKSSLRVCASVDRSGIESFRPQVSSGKCDVTFCAILPCVTDRRGETF